jgi:hypothetical protein
LQGKAKLEPVDFKFDYTFGPDEVNESSLLLFTDNKKASTVLFTNRIFLYTLERGLPL